MDNVQNGYSSAQNTGKFLQNRGFIKKYIEKFTNALKLPKE